MKQDVVIIGAGAAGLFCAFTAGRRGRKVLVLEHSEEPGKKIRISGGGRCNFTNAHAGPENYLSENPAFCRSALAGFSPEDFTTLVEAHGIAWHEKKLGQQFCDRSSQEIVDLLLLECQRAGVEIRTGCRIEEVRPGYEVRTTQGAFTADSLVVATGGLSFPKLGATDFGYRLARQFGMRVTPMRPGLVPLTLPESELGVLGKVSGLSLPVRMTTGRQAFEEAMLVTHRGLSGPAVLQISSFWKPGDDLMVDLLPGKEPDFAAGSLVAALAGHWPRRFTEAWSQLSGPQKPWKQWSEKDRRGFLELVHRWPVPVAGTEGYAKAEVTLGGVSTSDLSSKTLESRISRRLYFIGEVVDVTGWLGGFNFQWAWASAHAAGQAV